MAKNNSQLCISHQPQFLDGVVICLHRNKHCKQILHRILQRPKLQAFQNPHAQSMSCPQTEVKQIHQQQWSLTLERSGRYQRDSSTIYIARLSTCHARLSCPLHSEHCNRWSFSHLTWSDHEAARPRPCWNRPPQTLILTLMIHFNWLPDRLTWRAVAMAAKLRTEWWWQLSNTCIIIIQIMTTPSPTLSPPLTTATNIFISLSIIL